MSDLIQTGFDYGALPVDAALNARAAAERIKLRLKRTVEDIIEIGRELTAVKADLPHGQFLPWIAAEFEMSRQTADNFESVYARFGKDKVLNFSIFKPPVLYALAAPSTPEAVIDKAVVKAESGEKVTVADVKDWKTLEAELEAERQAREIAERRAQEFGQESNDRRKTIRDLLLDMRVRKGWKALGYDSFVEYGEKELKLGNFVYRLADAAEIGLQIGISPIDENQPKETHLRPLKAVPEEERKAIWEEATRSAPRARSRVNEFAAVPPAQTGEGAQPVGSPPASAASASRA